MARKRSPIFQKVSNLFKISIFIAMMRKPIIPKPIFLKKLRKLKKLKLLKHYNYGYIQEYQFSPSNTPLIHYRRKSLKKREYRDMYSFLFVCACLGGLRSGEGGDGDYPLEALPAFEDHEVARELGEFSDLYEEEDSVDERAERFIERFYEEIRMQRQESLSQLMEC